MTIQKSIWQEKAPTVQFPKLDKELSVDVAVIGGGIAGTLATAFLKQAGKTVVLLEAGRLASGETGYTTAHVTAALDFKYQDLIQKFGSEVARVVAESHQGAVEQLATLVEGHGIACGFERLHGYLYTEQKSEIDLIQKEFEAAKTLGLPVQISTEATSGFPETTFPFPVQSAVQFANQAEVNPVQLVTGLAQALNGDGAQVFEGTRVKDGQIDPAGIKLLTAGGTITAQDVVVAGNVMLPARLFPKTKAVTYRTYVVGVRMKRLNAPESLLWDTGHPYRYIRSAAYGDDEILIVGGEDSKLTEKVDQEERWRRLEEYAAGHFQIESVDYRWSGLVHESVDGLPYIGPSPLTPRIHIATEFYGNGMTYGTIAAMILTDTILRKTHPWADVYAGRHPNRKLSI